MKRNLKVNLALILALTMVVGSAITALGNSSVISGVPSGGGVTPVVYEGNDPTISGYSAEKCDNHAVGTYLLNLKDPSDENVIIGTVTAEIYKEIQGLYTDVTFVTWSSTIPISYVWVKGGPHGGSLYQYTPPSYGDSGLYTPIDNNGKPSDVSHVTFYYTNAPEIILGRISGMKFHDRNANGQLDEGEEGLDGWAIEIYNNTDCTETSVQPEITGVGGAFLFTDLPLGTYYLKEAMTETQAENYRQTAPEENSMVVTLTENSPNFEGALFGNVELGTITVTKIDATTENPLSGWAFTLYTKIAGEGEQSRFSPVGTSKVTGDNGTVSWEDLLPGEYFVEETPQEGWEAVEPLYGVTPRITLQAGQVQEFTFCNQQEAIVGSISGMKFHDKNSNGILGEGENGLPGWKIELYTVFDATGPAIMQVSDKRLAGYEITGEDGEFEFTGLPLGRYYLREAMTTGQAEEYEQTTPEGNWFTVDLAENNPNVSGVLFGNARKETPPEEPPDEEPPDEEPPDEEPPVEEPPAEEPPVEEPPAEEPPVEDPPAEEPEIEIVNDEQIPLTTLPATGGVAPGILYRIGMLLTGTGIAIKRKRKF